MVLLMRLKHGSVCETDGMSVWERYDAWMNVCENTGFLRAIFLFIFFLRKSIEMPALYSISPCCALCQYDRRVFLQKAKFKGAASRVCSWALWILFKFSKSWEVLISKYFLGSASPLALSSPPDFDTNNLIEKSGRGTGAKNREKKGEVSISAGCN